MRNIFLFIILTHFSPLFAHSLPNSVISDCNLPAPTNLQAVEVGPSYATIAWDAVPEATGYLVSWYDESGAQVNAETTLDTEYEVQGLESGKMYNFRVASVCSSGGTGTIYSMVPIVPIIVELLVSSDNPFGNFTTVCEINVNPTATCFIDFSNTNMYIGKLKFTNLNQYYYFRLRYYPGKINAIDSKLKIDLIKPNFYPETPIYRPGLFTEYDSISGPIYQYGVVKSDKVPISKITISKLSTTKYSISIKKSNVLEDDLIFSVLQQQVIYSYSESNDDYIENQIENQENKDNIGDEVVNLKIFDMIGGLITEYINLDESEIISKLDGLKQGVFILQITSKHNLSSKIVFHPGNN